ncbi:MAG: hypothetical protein QOF62_1061 [Pyrinomonadaceae bacterium]|nr:hypothetical protein [Pyrinomonadaceae bacterium]
MNNFYRGAYGRDATSTEIQQQRDALNAAAAQSQEAVQSQAETFGRSLFAGQVNDSSISDTQFVTNLYEAFLQRGPDAGGLGWWSGQATVGTGRQNVLGAFAGCTAFRDLSGTLYREANWLVSDHLGTPRMIANKSGSLSSMKRHDYLPFGEELTANIGGRTPTQGYTGDSVRQKFTQKERDNETGLDYFGGRYYASLQGRFTSADSFAGSRFDPQSLNRYAYVQNNPLAFTDPTGHMREPWTINPLDYLFGPRVSEPMLQAQGKAQTPVRIESGGSTSGIADDGRHFNGTLKITELGEAPESKPDLFRRIWSGIKRRFPGFSGGTTVGGGAGLGTGMYGAGGVGSVQSGLFIDNNTGHINAGNTAAGGLVIGAHNFQGSNPNGPELRLPRVPGESMVAGAWWEIGGGLWFSNARSVRELAGPFQTTHLSLIFVSVQVDEGGNGVKVFSATAGPGAGAGVYKSPTNTAILWDADAHVP